MYTLKTVGNPFASIKKWAVSHLALMLGLVVGLLFYILAHWALYGPLNYTFVVARALLHGRLGVFDHPSWLNELVPSGGPLYYSVFPLGAVLSVLPLSALVNWHVLSDYPVAFLTSLLAGGAAALAYAYTGLRAGLSAPKRLLLASWLVIGTWYATNLLFAGSWQLALGLAVLGELGALYWSAVKPRPFLAGLALAIAFGNRTEVILTAPIILIYLLRPYWRGICNWRPLLAPTLKFALAPVILGLLTLWYNFARFGNIADFGYARIPGVLQEPWYQHGIFSFYAVPDNIRQMLFQPWHFINQWPYLVPTGWGGSIILASPFLLLLLRRPTGDRLRYLTAWAAIIVLTLSLWLHGNTGGWQYSYRYSMTLLPWLLVLFVEILPDRLTRLEIILWSVSVITTAIATYLFLFTNYLT